MNTEREAIYNGLHKFKQMEENQTLEDMTSEIDFRHVWQFYSFKLKGIM